MTSNEIRYRNDAEQSRIAATQNQEFKNSVTMRMIMFGLMEIAAQLAEFNERERGKVE